MTNSIASSIAAAIGTDHVRTDGGGRIVATPPSVESLAHTLGLAYDNGWSTVVAGAGSWQVNDAPAKVVISTRALDQMVRYHKPYWSITAQGGASLDFIRRCIGERGASLYLEPPGRPDRSIGSIVATGTLGSWKLPLESQVSGLTVVTGDGRILRIEDRGTGQEEETQPHIGGFGAFGVLAEVSVLVRESKQIDQTFVALGDRDQLTAAVREFDNTNLTFPVVSAAEILSPALAAQSTWMLGIRHVHNGDPINEPACEQLMAKSPTLVWRELESAEATQFWGSSARAMIAAPITLRLSATAPGFDETLDLVIDRLGEGAISATPNEGTLRWNGAADIATLRGLRSELAAREIPLTLERAPWPIRSAVGHLGVFHEGLGGELSRLRQEFDPHGILAPALVSEPGN